mmetsp:Transcript_16871/g.42297  ORF Transcript_16871/g.42297 Transcript_16871/m.42297 type:complete len:205 (-) Transcript_16871:738-1352(-)
MGPSLAHSAATSSFSSPASVGSACSSSSVNICLRITVTSSAFFTSSKPFQSSRFSWLTTMFFFCFLFCGFFFIAGRLVFCANCATVTLMGGPPGRSGAPSRMVHAISTLGSLRNVTSPSPFNIPEASSLYSFIRGALSSFSLMIPHLPNAEAISSTVTSPGSPVTYTFVFFLSSNQVSSFFFFSLASWAAFAIFSFCAAMASAR